MFSTGGSIGITSSLFSWISSAHDRFKTITITEHQLFNPTILWPLSDLTPLENPTP